MHRYVSAYELNPQGSPFVDLGPGFQSHDVSALPRGAVERLVTRPRLSRLRAAAQAVALSNGDPIISHLPRLTATVAGAQRLSGNRARHLAFSFNFTDLPTGARLAMFRAVLGRVDRFVTFSAFETALYADRFGIEQERFRLLPWAQPTPIVAAEPTPFSGRPYVCALGGEGRDYATLAKAARMLPHLDVVVIARTYNAIGARSPNMRVLCDIPAPLAWRIAQESRLMVLPLMTRETCCGHITLVAAKLLGIPTVSTFSRATEEYVDPTSTCPPGDPDALARLIQSAFDHADELRAGALARVDAARATHSREAWKPVVEEFVLGR